MTHAAKVPVPSRISRRRVYVAAAVGVVIGCLALLLVEGVQAWLVRRWIAEQPGWRVQFSRFAVGPRALIGEGVAVELPWGALSCARVRVQWKVHALLRGQLAIERLEVHDLRIGLAAPAAESAVPSLTSPPVDRLRGLGALREMRWPLAWTLAELECDGEFIGRPGADPVQVRLRGHEISSETGGVVEWTLTAPKLASGRGVRGAQGSGTLTLVADGSGGIEHVGADGMVQLDLGDSLGSRPLSLSGALRRDGAGEELDAWIADDRGTSVTLSARRQPALASGGGGIAGRVVTEWTEGSLPAPWVPLGSAGSAEAQFAFSPDTGRIAAELKGEVRAVPERWAPHAGALRGRIHAEVVATPEEATVEQLAVDVVPESGGGAVRVALEKPWHLLVPHRNPPADPLVARLTVEAWPLSAWMPALPTELITLSAATLSGSARLTVDRDDRVAAETTAAWRVGQVGLGGPFAPLAPATVTTSLSGWYQAGAFALRAERLRAEGARGLDSLEVRAEASRGPGDTELTVGGSLEAMVPTLLPSSGPVRVKGRFRAGEEALGIEALTASVEQRTPGIGSFRVELDGTVIVPWARWGQVTARRGVAELRLKAVDFPIATLALPAWGEAAGSLIVRGDSRLQVDERGAMALLPGGLWQVSGSIGGAGAPLVGRLSLQPSLAWREGALKAGLQAMKLELADGSALTASLDTEWAPATAKGAIRLEASASIPAGKVLEPSAGALAADLRFRASNASDTFLVIDTLEGSLRRANGQELLSVRAPAEVLVGIPHASLVFATMQPLRVETGALPLAWLPRGGRLGLLQVEGELEPAAFDIKGDRNRWEAIPAGPVRLRGQVIDSRTQQRLERVELSAEPRLELTLVSVVKPTFQMAFTGQVQTRDATLMADGKKAATTEARVEFLGNLEKLFPSAIEARSQVDLAAVARTGAAWGVPSAGQVDLTMEGNFLERRPMEVKLRIDGIPESRGGGLLPRLDLAVKAQLAPEGLGRRGEMNNPKVGLGIALQLATVPAPSDAAFDLLLDLDKSNLYLASELRSRHFDLPAMLELAQAFSRRASEPGATRAGVASTPREPSVAAPSRGPFWGNLRGSFLLDLQSVRWAPYRIDELRGRLEADESGLRLRGLTGRMFNGQWAGEVAIQHRADAAATEPTHRAEARFNIAQFESARVVQTVFPNELASVDARIDVAASVRAEGSSLRGLLDRASADFTVQGQRGVLRLTVPKQDSAATAAVFGGTLLLSPELRALGRLLRKFAEMPVSELRITGERSPDGDVQLHEFRIESPQTQLVAQGRIEPVPGKALMERPLSLEIDLAAREDVAVILGRMDLLERKPRADGFQRLRERFRIGGRAGEPDTRPLYDLLAKAVVGSKGTWRLLMRRLQERVMRSRSESGVNPAPPPAGPSE